MPKINPYLVKNIDKLPENYTVSYYNETEWNKGLTPEEMLKRDELAELEYQDKVLNGPQFGPGNEQSRAVAITVAGAVAGGVAIVATGGAATPLVAATARVVQGTFQAHHVHQQQVNLENRHLALLGLGVGFLGLANSSGNSQSSSSSSATTHVEKKTIYDWWCNGITGKERDYLLAVGYSDTGFFYSLQELKHVAKNRERELLTQESQTYIQAWIDEVDYSSEEERRRNEQVVNCSKKDSPVWKGLKHHKGDIRTNGKSGSHRRYYQWDNTHNDIEVYNSRGKHLGSMDPRNGNIYKGSVSGRSISHLL